MALSDLVNSGLNADAGASDAIGRRDFMRGGTLAALGFIAAPRRRHAFSDRNKPIETMPQYVNVSFDVNTYLEGKDISKEVADADDIINVELKIDAAALKNQDLKVRYYMLNAQDKHALDRGDYAAISKNLILLGGRRDFSVDAYGKGELEGFFQYAQDLKETFVPKTPSINPYDANRYKSDQFYFLVQVLDKNNKLVASKWWSKDNKPAPIRFAPPLEERVEPAVVKKPKVPGKPRVFIYKQSLSRKKWDAELGPATDFFQPHLYEFEEEGSGIGLKTKVRPKTMDSIKQSAKKYGYNILPMVSGFNDRLVRKLFDRPAQYAAMIKRKLDQQGLNGILIDLESVRLRVNDAPSLVKLMVELRQALPKGKYTIGIAVSPRFEGSEKNYPHHAFYDFRQLSRQVDYLQVMGYDFHNKKRGPSPIMPGDKLDDVVNYAKKHVDDPSKIVFLMPLYGYVWNRRGKGIGTIASSGNDRYLRSPGVISQIVNGELRIDTPSKIVFTQNGQVYSIRHAELDRLGIKNRGYWKQELAHPEVVQAILKM